MFAEEVLDEVVLVGVRLMMGCLLVPITHHCLEPHGFAVQVLCRRDLTAKNAVVAVLLQLACEDQTGAKEGENVEVIQQNGDTHVLTEDLHSLYVCEWAGTHAKGDEVQGAGHGIGDHHVRIGICHPVFEGQIFFGSPPSRQKLKHSFSSMT